MATDTVLKTYFETGDVPTQEQYEELIDSKINVNDRSNLFNVRFGIGTPNSSTPADAVFYVNTENQKIYGLTSLSPVTWGRMYMIPPGGTNGQLLAKSGDNWVWVNQTTGGTGTAVSYYEIGNATIKAIGTGITVGVVGNVYTVTVPNGQIIESLSIDENSTNITDSDFVVKIIYTGATIKHPYPSPSFLKRDNGGVDPPTSGNPFIFTVDNAPSPQMQVTNHVVGETEITFKNIDNFAKWTAILKF